MIRNIVVGCIICLSVYVLLGDNTKNSYNLTGSQDIKMQGGPDGRFILEREYPAYVLIDLGEYGKQKEPILFPVFIWTCENFKDNLYCYSEEGMVILKEDELYIRFIKATDMEYSKFEKILMKNYEEQEYTILNSIQSLDEDERKEYSKIKKRGIQERLNRIGSNKEKVDWKNGFQKQYID